jgi:hypothetical protein
MTGRVIAGRYNLQHPIGRGAMGVVWRARDQILDRDVAVKEVVISSSLGEEERRNAYQRTLREARTAARLSHRGLVAVYDVAEEDGRPWIVMELVPSRSLDQVLTVEGRLPSLRVARIGQQLLSALAAAHIAGVLVELALANEGRETIVYTLTRNDYEGSTRTVTVKSGGVKAVSWPTSHDGYYDVVITANTADGFRRRYAGRIA